VSLRVKLVSYHPDYGAQMNTSAIRCVSDEFNRVEEWLAQPFPKPDGFAKWEKWKQAAWKAKQLKKWQFFVYREPRATRFSRSAALVKFQELGGRLKAVRKRR